MPGPFRRLRPPGKAEALIAAATSLSRPLPPPSRGDLDGLVREVQSVLDAESPLLRPRDLDGFPGGLVDLPDLPVVLVPDLHTRADFLAAVLSWRPPLGLSASAPASARASEGRGPTLAALLEREEAVLVCLGDLFHSEGPEAAERWRLASREYLTGWEETGVMDEEMSQALRCAEIVLRAKLAFPSTFHYLKGNHDNIVNEEGHGDHPFYKYSSEGEMASSWFALRYGGELVADWRRLELSWPLVVHGKRFVASHAEPGFALAARDIIEYRHRPDVAGALTWTPNDGAEPGSVASTLSALLGPAAAGARWFAGHRPVAGRYALRAGGLFVQFHNPGRHLVALLKAGRAPDPDRDILDLDEELHEDPSLPAAY